MANHVVVRADKLMSAKYGNLVSATYSTDVDNGSFIKVGGLNASNKELFDAELCVDVEADAMLLVYSPEVQNTMYLPGKTLKDFTNMAGKPFSAYYLHEGDIVTITDNGIDGATVIGQYCIPQVGSLKLAASAAPTTEKLQLKVIDKLSASTAFSYTGSTFAKELATVLMVVRS